MNDDGKTQDSDSKLRQSAHDIGATKAPESVASPVTAGTTSIELPNGRMSELPEGIRVELPTEQPLELPAQLPGVFLAELEAATPT
jgi:hypothetical protein